MNAGSFRDARADVARLAIKNAVEYAKITSGHLLSSRSRILHRQHRIALGRPGGSYAENKPKKCLHPLLHLRAVVSIRMRRVNYTNLKFFIGRGLGWFRGFNRLGGHRRFNRLGRFRWLRQFGWVWWFNRFGWLGRFRRLREFW